MGKNYLDEKTIFSNNIIPQYGEVPMNIQANYRDQEIVKVISVTKQYSGYGHWTLRAVFETANGNTHDISNVTAENRMIDKWNDAISENDIYAVEACKKEMFYFILDEKIEHEAPTFLTYENTVFLPV